jgi:trimeric autotransporter adhesin
MRSRSIVAASFLVLSLVLASCGGGSSGQSSSPTQSPPSPTPSSTPSISSISPTTATAGGVGFDLVVHGKNFVSGSVVTWNGLPQPTTFFDGQLLFASISAGNIAATGTAQVAAMNPSSGGGASNAVAFTVTAIRLNSIEPAAVRAGGPGFTMTVGGKGFQFGATVHFGGKELTTTFVNTGQLMAQVANTDIANPGVEEITVANPAPSAEVSNSILFTSMASGIGATERISVASDGAQANGDSGGASMSANNRFVSFSSAATNLGTGATTGYSAFLRDTCFRAPNGCMPTTVTLPVTNVVQGTLIGATSVSADGRFVAFSAISANRNLDVFVWDTCGGVLSGCQPSVTQASNGVSTESSYSPALNATGRYVAFTTVVFTAGGPAAGFSQSGAVFVKDTCQGAKSGCSPSSNQVSFDENGATLDFAFLAGISADGRYAAFVHGEDGEGVAVFVRDTCAGVANCIAVSTRVSFDPAGNPFQRVGAASLSAEGRFVAFSGLEAQANRVGLFIRDTCLGVLSGCTPSTTRVSVDNTGAPFVSDSQNPSISADGRFVAFELRAFDRFDATQHSQIVIRDTCLGATGCTPVTILASHAADVTLPNGNSFSPFVSTGGSAVFTSGASNLVAGDTNGALDIFVARTGP